MDCCKPHDHNSHDEHHQGKGGGKFPLKMILCCLIPLLLAAALFSLGISWGYMMLLICPLLHGGMMWFLMKNNKGNREAVESE